MTYEPSDPRYWQPDLLAMEVTRVFEVCNGCRLCFKYCDSFPSLFDAIERRDGVRALTPDDIAGVMDACFQCKLCEVACPYSPRDGHPFQLDFPKLVHRWVAQRARDRGLRLRDRLLGDPDRLGRAARAAVGLANALTRTRLHRWFLDELLGIHRDKQLPAFAASTFEAWATATGKLRTRDVPEAPDLAEVPEVVVFQTCYVQHHAPEIGRDTLEVLARNGIDAACVGGLGCCGMPAWAHGDLDTLRANAAHNLDQLEPYVEAGAKIVVLQPTCAMAMRREHPALVAPEDRPRAERLAAAVVDPCELLWSIRGEPRFDAAFASSPGPVAYHVPCHLRAQAVGFRGRDLIRRIPGVGAPRAVVECCGHDGTRAFTTEGFEASVRLGARAFDGMRGDPDAPTAAPTGEGDGEVWVTDCALAALQFAQCAGVTALHPMTVLARAYRPDGFATALGGDR